MLIEQLYLPPKLPSFFALISGTIGKTTLACDLIQNYQDSYDKVIVISNHGLGSYYTTLRVGDEYRENADGVLQQVVEEQRLMTLGNTISCTLLVIDACDNLLQSDALRFCALTGRNNYLSLIITVQNVHTLPTVVQCNTDLLFMLKGTCQRFATEWSRLGEHELMSSLFEMCTKDHACLVLMMNRIMSMKVYKAKKLDAETQARVEGRLRQYEEELMQRTWHPHRLVQCGYDDCIY
jgi:hypothetical protein